MHLEPASGGGSFPLWIALCSTAAALGLFFSTTVPAIAELRFLHDVASQRSSMDQALSRELDRDALHQVRLEYDIQSLLVELDHRGVTPEAFLPAAPEPAGGDPW